MSLFCVKDMEGTTIDKKSDTCSVVHVGTSVYFILDIPGNSFIFLSQHGGRGFGFWGEMAGKKTELWMSFCSVTSEPVNK